MWTVTFRAPGLYAGYEAGTRRNSNKIERTISAVLASPSSLIGPYQIPNMTPQAKACEPSSSIPRAISTSNANAATIVANAMRRTLTMLPSAFNVTSLTEAQYRRL